MPSVEVALGESITVMPGKLRTRQVSEKGAIYVSTEDGSGAPFECWFLNNPKSMSQTLYNVSERVINNMGKNLGAVSRRQVFAIDAGEIDGSLFLSLEWLLVFGESSSAKIAHSKVRAAEKDGQFVACAHAMVGYRQSFADAFERIVTHLEAPSDYRKPYYSETYIAGIGGMKTGFSRKSFILDDEGNTEIKLTESALFPESARTIQTTDSNIRTVSTPDGYLLNSHYGAMENGNLVADLYLSKMSERRWQVAGEYNGHTYAASFLEPSRLVSSLGEMRSLGELVNNPEIESASMATWAPGARPETATRSEASRQDNGRTSGSLELNFGDIKMLGEYDASGSAKELIIDVGGASLLLRRVHVSGNPSRAEHVTSDFD